MKNGWYEPRRHRQILPSALTGIAITLEYAVAEQEKLFLTELRLCGDMSGRRVIELGISAPSNAVALASVKFTKAGQTVEYRSAQVWRIENGKPVAWYEYLRDGYQFDAIWS